MLLGKPAYHLALCFLAQILELAPVASRHRHLIEEDHACRSFHCIERYLELLERGVAADACIGQNKGCEAVLAVAHGKDHLVKVGWDGDVGRVTYHLVAHVPLVIDGILTRQVERAGQDVDVREGLGQAAAERFKVGPVCRKGWRVEDG